MITNNFTIDSSLAKMVMGSNYETIVDPTWGDLGTPGGAFFSLINFFGTPIIIISAVTEHVHCRI